MTFAERGAKMPVRRGVVVDLPPTAPHWNKQIQRAEGDGGGSPVGGTETILETIPGSQTRYVDDGSQESFSADTSYIYRYRFTRVGASDGSWSDWTDEHTPSGLWGQQSPPSTYISTSVSLEIRDDGTPVARGTASQDAEGGTIHLTIATGSDPSAAEPDGTEDTVDLAAGVRAWTHTFTGTTVSKGDAASVKARAETTGEKLALAKYIEPAGATRAGDQTTFDGTPTAELRENSRDPNNILYDLRVASGSDVSDPDLRYRYLVTEPGQTADFSGQSWNGVSDANDGAWLDQAISASRSGKAPKQLHVQAQDQAPASQPTVTTSYPIGPKLEGVDDDDGRIDPGTEPGGTYTPPGGGTPPTLSKYLDTSHEARQNLLGQDAGPEHSGTARNIYNYGRLSLADMELEPGDVVSASLDLKSATGSDTLDGEWRFYDSGGSLISQPDFGDLVVSSTFARSRSEGQTIPANTAEMDVRAINTGQTEEATARRAMLNKGPIAESFEHPPLRKFRETSEDLLRDVDGASVEAVVSNLLASGFLAENMKHETGGEVRQITRGLLMGRHPHDDPCPDGGSSDGFVDFTQAIPGGFSEIPSVVLMPAGRYNASSLGDELFIVQSADGLDEQGFCMKAILQEKGATSGEQDDFPAGTLTTDGEALSLAGRDEGQNGGNGLTATDTDNEYEVQYDGLLTANSSQGDPQNARVDIYVDVWDNDASSPQWVEVSKNSHSIVTESSKTNTFDESQTFNWSAIDSGDDIRVRIAVTIGPFGTGSVEVDPDNVVYTSSASAPEESMSPNGEKIPWLAMEGR